MTVNHDRQTSPVTDPALHPAVAALGAAVAEAGIFRGQVWAVVAPGGVVGALRLLRDDPRLAYNFLSDLAGAHYPQRAQAPFEVVYQLTSLSRADRFRLKTRLSGEENVPSAVSVFPGADWLEREAFDQFGILFSGHPDLRRILNPEGFSGHPLRKDFPVRGKVTW